MVYFLALLTDCLIYWDFNPKEKPLVFLEMNSITKTLRMLTKSPGDNKNILYATYAIFIIASLYIFYCSQITTIGLAIGVTIILQILTNNLPASLVGGALVGLVAVFYSRSIGKKEGFTDSEATAEAETTDAADAEEKDKEDKDKKEKKKDKEGFSENGKKRLPDNGDRAEMFELGKKYKGPSEEDDSDYHLDAGTTFMNAYKSLKPDQINAMTKDTQELMATQKQLMSTLSTLKPMIQDGKQMMDMFQSYFGSGGAPGTSLN